MHKATSKYLVTIILIASFLLGCSDGQEGGDQFFQEGQYQEAIDAYTESLQSGGDDEEIRFNRGRAYQEIGNFSAARSDFEEVLAKNSRHTPAIVSLAQVAYQGKNYERTLLYAEKALEIDDRSVEGYFMKARANHQMGYTEAALKAYNQVIYLDKDNGDAFLYRGALKLALKLAGGCQDLRSAKNLGAIGAEDAFDRYCK